MIKRKNVSEIEEWGRRKVFLDHAVTSDCRLPDTEKGQICNLTQMYKLNAVPSMSDEDILRELKEVVDIIVQVAKTPEGRKVQSIYYKYGHLRKNNEGLL